MVKLRFFQKTLLIVCTSVLVFSCRTEPTEDEVSNFDRGPMLAHYSKDIIRPAYNDLQASTNTLKSAVDVLVSDLTTINLVAAQDAWIQAYGDFQYVSAFNFGPAGEAGIYKTLTEEIGLFPVSETKIEDFISANDNSLNNFDRDSRGYLAVEYLLFDLGGTNANILTELADVKRRDYLVAITNQCKSKVSAVANAWTTYQGEFVSNSGSDAGSSISLLFNSYLQGYEQLKNYKVGLPAGLRAGQVATEPTKVAGYYSGKSLDFIKKHFESVEQVWFGKNKAGVDGTGFQEYLSSVEGGQALVDQTKHQFGNVNTAMDAVPTNVTLPTTIQSDKSTVDELYLQLSALTRFIKSDMSSLLGIYITYASGDGD